MSILTNNLAPSHFADCDSYCKASKGKLKINMKKYCKKDYGESTKNNTNWVHVYLKDGETRLQASIPVNKRQG